MGITCITEGLGMSEWLDQAQKWFPKRTRADLANLLGTYFERKGFVQNLGDFAEQYESGEVKLTLAMQGALPTMGQLREHIGWIKRRSNKAGDTSLAAAAMMNRRRKMLEAFPTSERLDIISMIARDFNKAITRGKPADMTRADYINSRGGVQGVMQDILGMYQRMSSVRWWNVRYEMKNTSTIDEIEDETERNRMKELHQRRADTYKKIVEHFNALAMETLDDIQKLEEIETDYYGVSLQEAIERRNEEENETYGENNVHGENYNIDYRTRNLQDTLSVVADRVLRMVPLLDDNRKQVTNSIGYQRFVDPLRIHGFLHTIVGEANTSEEMLALIQERSEQTPWVQGLYDILEKDDIATTAIFDNYKRTITRYATVYSQGSEKPLQIGMQNDRYRRNAALKSIASTMLSGIVLQKGTSIYNGNGELETDPARIEQIDALFKQVKTLMQDAVQGTSAKPDKVAKRHAWLQKHPEAVEVIGKAVRSLGLEISDKHIQRLIFNTDFTEAEKKRFKGYSGVWAVLRQLKRIHEDYHSALKEGMSPEDFVGKYAPNLRSLSSMLGVVSYDDVEPHALIDGKSYMTYTNPNLLHQTADELVGRGRQNKEQSLREYIWETFGRHEGFHLNRTRAEIEAEIQQRLDTTDVDRIQVPPGLEDNPRAIAEARQIAHDELLREYEDDLTRGARTIGWLNETTDDEDSDMFQVLDVLQLQLNTKKEPGKWDMLDRLKVDFALFRRQSGSGRNAAYAVPIESDYNVYNAITAPVYEADLVTTGALGEQVYNTQSEIVKLFVDEVKAEMQRVNRIQRTLQQGNDPKERVVMKTYEKEGARYHIFPRMNEDDTVAQYNALAEKPGGGIEADLFLAQTVAKYLYDYATEKIQQYNALNAFAEPEFKSLVKNGALTDAATKSLSDFFVNELYAQYQIAKIFFGGEHFFKNLDEYHKRGMFAHAPRTVVDTTAKWNGEYVLDPSKNGCYSTAIIEDPVINSSYKNQIEKVYDDAIEAGLITKEQKMQYMKMWDGLTTTDGQAFRSLPSFREICIMADKGAWTEKHEAAYNALIDGNVTPEILDTLKSITLAQNLKTVVTGFSEVDTGELDDLGNNVTVRQPFIYKHSEAVMFAPYLAEAIKKKMPQYQSPLIRAIGDFMTQNRVDVVEFHSCVKMGDTGVISAGELTSPEGKELSAEKIAFELGRQYKVNKGAQHMTPYKYYGIAASTPVDYADVNRAFSSQAVKMTWNDIQDEDEMTLPNGQVIKSKEGKRLFYRIQASNIQDAWDTLKEQFNNIEDIEALLQQELASKSYNSKDLKYALSLVEQNDGKLDFVIPLISPATARTVQNLLTSVIRNRLGKERTKGGNLIQQTALGFDTYADVHYTDETPGDWESLKIVFKKDGNGNDTTELEAIEVYMPIHDRRLLRYADETGAISPKRLKELIDDGIIDKRILEFIAYRTPTDGIHATLPLRIKGFLPHASGGNIIMPSEVMTLTGNDFDIDKMLCHFKDFKVSYWDEEKLWKAYNLLKSGEENTNELGDAVMALFSLSREQLRLLEKDRLSYKSFRNALREDTDNPVAQRFKYEQPHISLIEYDYESEPERQSKEARNNAEIELIFANITSKKGTQRFCIPGGFEGIKQLAYTTWLLDSQDEKVKDMLKAEMKKYGFTTRKQLRDFLLKQPSKKLSDYVNSARVGVSGYDIFARHSAHKEIMDGRDSIAQYALFNSGMALLQGSGIRIAPIKTRKGELHLNICGYELNALDGIFDSDDQLISTTRAQLISAAVDNRNNPILSFLNQNEATIGLTNTLVSAKLPVNLVFAIMSQPIVKRFAEIKMKNPYAAASTIWDAVIEQEKDRYNTPSEASKWKSYPQGYASAVKHISTRDEADLVENIGASLQSRDPKFVKDQLAIAYVLKAMSGVADDLNTLIMCLRPENAKNGCGPFIGSTVANIKRIEDFQQKIAEGKSAIVFDDPVLTTFIPGEHPIEQAQEQNGILPMTTLLNSLMLYGSSQLLSRYLSTARPQFMQVTQAIADLYNQNRLKDASWLSIQNEIILWKLMKNQSLVTTDMKADRQDLVVELPKRVQILKQYLSDVRARLQDPETAKDVTPTEKALADNKLLQKLWAVRPSSETNIPRLQLRLGGVLTEKIAQQIRDAWDALLYTTGTIEAKVDDETHTIDIQKMAIDLFRYNLYTDGFGFSQYTIVQMAPPSVQLSTPGWIEALRSLDNHDVADFIPEEFERFKTQYIQNHWYNSRLVPRVDDEAWNKMLVEEKDGVVILRKKVQQTDLAKGTPAQTFDPESYLWNSGFMLHRGEEGKATLYRVEKIDEKDGSMVLREYPKVGCFDARYQTALQYEPYTDPLALEAVQTGIDSSWGNFDRIDVNDPKVGGENNIDAENPMDNQERDLSEREIRMQEILRKLGMSDTLIQGEPTQELDINNALQTGTVIVEQPNTIANTEAQTEAANERNSLLDQWESSMNHFFSLVRHTTNEQGKNVVQTVQHPASPAVVREARAQKANHELNKALRQILANVGVGVGVLQDFEAELGAAGVTDFSMSRVVAEGLIEMIRIAEGEEGEYALPEEFSHLAIAMLGPANPLVERLMNSMSDDVIREVLGEFYEDYNEKYQGNRHKMAFEAAGKLVAKHLLDGQPIPQKPYKSLLQRIIDGIKNILRKIGIRDVQYEIAKAEDAANFIAQGLLEGDLANLMAMDNITETSKYFATVHAMEQNGTRLEEILKRDIRRYKILEKRVANQDEDRKAAVLDPAVTMIEKMEDAIAADKQDIAINDYLQEALKYIKKCDEGITHALNSVADNNTICRRLRLDRDLIFSFQDNLRDLRAYARSNPGVLSTDTVRLLGDCQTVLTEFYERYHECAMSQFVSFIKSVMGDQMTVGIGKNKGTIITAEGIAQSAERDINFINRWLDSMADQPDMVNKIFDEAVRQYKDRVRRMDIDMRVRIDKAFADLLRATGSRDQSFMFERDAEGKRTGKYIDDETAKNNLSDAQYKFYKEMIAIKKEVDLFLPVSEKSSLRTIKIRKDLLDRLKNAEDFGEGFKAVSAALQDKILVRSDDEDYLAAHSIVDFEGNKVDMVPLYYLKLGKGEKEEDVSEDVASTMLAYSHMAHNYKELSGIIDILENARSMAQERRVTMRRGGKQEQETVADERISNRIVTTLHTKQQKITNIGKMLDDFFEMQVYNHLRKDEGTLGDSGIAAKISKQKTADVINELTSLSTMALNFNQRIANITVGSIQMLEEAASREFYSAGTFAKAQAFYFEHLPEMMRYTGLQTNPSFLSLLNEMFDISQENARSFRDREYRKNFIEKNADTGLLTLGLAWGENLMSMTTGIGILMEHMVKSPSGEEVPILKALKISYADPANKAGARMDIAEGYTNTDGSAITTKDIYKLTKKIAGVNQKLQGIYNTNDKSMIQQYAIGTLIMMFRKWMVPNLRRRYGGANYNFMTETWTEGFYTSFVNFIRNNFEGWLHDIRHLRAVVSTNWDKLSPEEKANVRRAIAELGTAAGIMSAIFLLGRIHMDDDKDGKGFSDWLYNLTYYQLLRMKTEVFAQIPGPQMLTEGTKLLAEPFAGMRTLENTFSALNLLTVDAWTKRVPSGRYKGHRYAYKYFMQLPVISMGRTVSRAFDQSDLIEYYKRGGF